MKLTGGRFLTKNHLVLLGVSVIFSHLSESASRCSRMYLVTVPSSSSGGAHTRVSESRSIFSALKWAGGDGLSTKKEATKYCTTLIINEQ